MEQKDPLITKRAAPLLHKIRDLSLRRGDGGLRDLCRVFRKERIGTEELKSELNAFGVELSGAECTVLFQAYRDAIGYLLTTPFLSDLLATTGPATRDAVNVVFESLAPTVIPLTGLQRKAGYSTARRVVGLAAVLSTAVPSRDPAVVTGRRTVDEADSEFSDIFNARHYPDGQVPEAEFRAYYAAIALQAGQSLSDEALADAIYRHWGVQRNGEGSILASTTNRTLGSTLAPGELSLQLSSMTVGNALPHKSKFVEVRDKIDVPSRVVGYHGHLRTAQEHFGETFHRVEASIPPFRRGNYDEALPTPVDPSYGLVRQGNKANVHNFRFA